MSQARLRLAVLVHEVRSPVAALAAIATAFGSDSSSDGRRSLVDLAVAACRAIDRVVGDAAIGSVCLQPVDVYDIVRQAVETAALRGASVRVDVEPDLPAIEADRERLRQALDNLIANAEIHADGEEIVVRAFRGDGAVVLAVSDRGPGIAKEDQQRVLEAGVRLDVGRPGSGLGLAVVRAIADAHGASLRVESTPGEGSTFSLAFPVP